METVDGMNQKKGSTMTATTKRPAIYGGEADESWGYTFGVDGLMDPETAGKFLCVSGRQLDRLAADSKIRKGLMPSGVRRFCERSVREFAQSLEK